MLNSLWVIVGVVLFTYMDLKIESHKPYFIIIIHLSFNLHNRASMFHFTLFNVVLYSCILFLIHLIKLNPCFLVGSIKPMLWKIKPIVFSSIFSYNELETFEIFFRNKLKTPQIQLGSTPLVFLFFEHLHSRFNLIILKVIWFFNNFPYKTHNFLLLNILSSTLSYDNT